MPADPTTSGPTLEARAAFRQGVELRAKGNLRGALAEFERAYRLSPAFQVLYFIGAVNAELGQWANARRAFELYLTLGSTELSATQTAEVRVHLEELSKYTATLSLTLNVPGADVQVNGVQVEPTTLSGLILDEGEHVVRVSKPGFQPIEEVVRVAVGQDIQLVLPLVPVTPPVSAAARAPSTVPPDPVPLGRDPTVDAAASEPLPLWVPWGLTGALAAGWVTTGALALRARHDRNVIERPGTSDARLDAARRLHLTLAIVSDVLLASTLASAGVSAYLTWWSDAPLPSGRGRATPQPTGGPVLGLRGHF